jgi:sulfatase maturation enzyme AslB (radical SAM superfamily)
MLPLYGTASFSRGVAADTLSSVVRLRSDFDLPGMHDANFALVRSEVELKQAMNAHCSAVMIVSDDELEAVPHASQSARLIRVPGKFDYLSDGDIIGFQPQSGKFRTLYRPSSRHNSFLVTDRCNHYCLMCSQPPKDIDDRWLSNELKTALPLVAKDTKSLCFTGGEPLLEWREFIDVLAWISTEASRPNGER